MNLREWTLRHNLALFAWLMENKLNENDCKMPHYSEYTTDFLWKNLTDQILELMRAVTAAQSASGPITMDQAIIVADECANVANWCMRLATLAAQEASNRSDSDTP